MLEFIMCGATHCSKLDAVADYTFWVSQLCCFPLCNENKIIINLCSFLPHDILDAVHPKIYKKISCSCVNSNTNMYK